MIKIDKIDKIFNENNENSFQALKDINLNIKKGELILLKGISGSGKSTLLNIIATFTKPTNGKIAVCFIDGEFTVKRIKIEGNICWLIPENEKYQPIKVTEENDFIIWGIVIHVIKSL